MSKNQRRNGWGLAGVRIGIAFAWIISLNSAFALTSDELEEIAQSDPCINKLDILLRSPFYRESKQKTRNLVKDLVTLRSEIAIANADPDPTNREVLSLATLIASRPSLQSAINDIRIAAKVPQDIEEDWYEAPDTNPKNIKHQDAQRRLKWFVTLLLLNSSQGQLCELQSQSTTHSYMSINAIVKSIATHYRSVTKNQMNEHLAFLVSPGHEWLFFAAKLSRQASEFEEEGLTAKRQSQVAYEKAALFRTKAGVARSTAQADREGNTPLGPLEDNPTNEPIHQD